MELLKNGDFQKKNLKFSQILENRPDAFTPKV